MLHHAARPVPPRAVVLSAQSQAGRQDEPWRRTRLSEPERTKRPWGATVTPPSSSPPTPAQPCAPHPLPAQRATYPSPLTRPGPPPLAQSQRRLLGGSRQAGGASGARARGPDVRPAEGVGGAGGGGRGSRTVRDR